VASRFEYVPNRKDTTIDHFTIVVWDDGESLVNTLKKAIEDGVNVRASSLDAVYCFKTKYVDTKGSVYENEIKSDFTPAKGLEEHEILISSLLPGITRDPSGKDHIIHKEIMEIPELSTPGMGLFILINAAIDVFGGSVAFRTSRFFMNVKAPSDKEKREEGISYRAKVVEYSEKVPSFMGNMITIRLPIKGNN
jgi:hypothetical protein